MKMVLKILLIYTLVILFFMDDEKVYTIDIIEKVKITRAKGTLYLYE